MRVIPYVVLLTLLLLFPLAIRAAPDGDIGEKRRQVDELTRLLDQALAAQGPGGSAFKENGNSVLRVSCFRGAQRSFLQDWDVEVAEETSISDPIINIAQTGFAFDSRPIVSSADLIVVDLQVQISNWREGLVFDVRPTLAVPMGSTVVVGGALEDGDDEAVLMVVKPTAYRPGRRR